MISNLVFVALVLVLGVGTAAGQTEKDLSTKYRREKNVYSLLAENVYSMSEHIWMTPAYDANGQVCSMQLYPKHISPDTYYPDESLDVDEVLKVINELVPPSTRGARKDLFGGSDFGGGVIWTHFDYDHVAFTFISFFKIDKLPDHQFGESEGLDFLVDEKSLDEARRREAMRSDDELMSERARKSKRLAIRWVNRKCVELQTRSNNSLD